ncbi:MAG: YgcG family protein [Burkholderiaceae bacterium]
MALFWMRVRAAIALGLVTLFCLAYLAPAAGASEAPVPTLTTRITDLTKTLDAATQKSLEQKLAGLEQRKGAQVAVLIVPTTSGESVETYATRVFDQWKLGRKNVDDGILFVIAKNDHHMRIEVGYGLEGAVPDILAGRIMREQVTPLFKRGDFAGGITAGVDSLIKLVSGESLPAPVAGTQGSSDGGASFGMLLPLAFMAFVLPSVLAALAVGLFAFFTFHSIGLALLGAILALVVSALGRSARAGGPGGPGAAARASRRGGVIGGLGGLGGFGGGGGGGFGGGGFGGGGGGSGGGGASGGW